MKKINKNMTISPGVLKVAEVLMGEQDRSFSNLVSHLIMKESKKRESEND